MRADPHSTTLALLLVLTPACGDGDGGAAAPDDGARSYGPADHVTAARYGGLLLEVDAVEAREPGESALADVEARLDDLHASGHLAKPDGIDVRQDQVLPPLEDPQHVRTFAELDALAAAHRSLEPADGASHVHVLYVDGSFEDDGDDGLVLGFAWGGASVVMLKDNIERACASSQVLRLPALRSLVARVCEASEASVLLHELGHLFGLVDNGAPMVEPHRDPEHGAHCDDEECLMFWAVARSTLIDLVAERFRQGDEETSPFDEACLADLAGLHR